MKTFDQFMSDYTGKGIDWDGYFGFQCVDLARKYIDECLGYPQPPPGNAINFWTNFSQPEYYDRIPNTPTGVPLKGDIVIWGSGVGSNGHIAVFVSGNTMSFVSFDQNWPVGTVCHQQNHNYNYVLGWLHPKGQQAGTNWEQKYNNLAAKMRQIRDIANNSGV